MKIPLIIVGDAPTQPTGLARIARDVAELIAAGFPDQVELHFVGYQPAGGAWAPWNGDYPLWTFSDLTGWGAPLVQRVIEVLVAQGNPRGIVWPIWDADRAYELAAEGGSRNWELWLYPAIDAVDQNGSFFGPGRAAIKRADRVAAYGDWAAGVLGAIRRHPVEALPHGLHEPWFGAYQERPADGALRIGCVATNQQRKDLPLFFRTIKLLSERGRDVVGWLHTNQLLGAYSVNGLVAVNRLRQSEVAVTLSGPHTTDQWLRERYRLCDLTIGVGRGEGFGYPAVESMASGIPHLAVDYAGGAELLPPEWRVAPAGWITDGRYSLRRPIVPAGRMADLVEAVATQPDRFEVACTAARRYHWVESGLQARWHQWIARGLDEMSGGVDG